MGQTGHCPNCRAVVCAKDEPQEPALVPEVTPEKMLERIAVAETMSTEEAMKLERSMKNRKRKYAASAGGDGIDWEEEVQPGDKKTVSWKVVVSLIASAFALGGFGIYVLDQVTPPLGEVEETVADDKTRILLNDIVEAQRETGKEEEGDEAAQAVDDYKKFDIPAVEAAVKSFLNAENFEEMKATVRDLDRVEPLMDLYYSKVDFEVEGFDSMNKANVSYRGNLLTTSVVKADFIGSAIAVERVVSEDGDSYKVDWESWVGYCDFTAEEMRSKNPTKPFLLRVLIGHKNYYNYGFGDDKVWRSYGLELKDPEYSFLGYVKKGSKIDEELIEVLKKGGKASYVVKVAYHPNSRAKDQVEIVELVDAGWVVNKESFLKDKDE